MKKEHWIMCPLCQCKTHTKIYEDTVLLNFPLDCDNCKKETVINVIKLKMVLPESASQSD